MPRRLGLRAVCGAVLLGLLTNCGPEKEPPEGLNSAQVLNIVCGREDANPMQKKGCEGRACVVEGHIFGKEVAYLWLDEGDLESANLILEDTWPVPRFDPVHLPPPLTWTEDPYGEKFWRYIFYGLRPTAHLLWAFRETGERRYRDKLMDVFRSFAADSKNSVFSRDKHGTAYRAMVFVNSYWKLKHAGALSREEAQLLEQLILEDARFLEDPKNFEAGFNHGFAEAAALLLIAENFPHFEDASRWRELALARYDDLLSDIIGSDGFIIENSAYYQFYVFTQVYQLAQWARTHGVELPPQVWPVLERMARFASYIVQPDGHIPMLGASQRLLVRKHQPVLLARMGAVFPELAHMLTAGMCGSAPTERLAFFESSGVAVLRSSFDPALDYREQTHLIFDMGPYRTDHSHLDALNVVLYSAGRTLLTDPGMFTEEPGDEEAYFRSTRAHNTVTVDGLDQRAGHASPGLSAQGGRWLYQSGFHTLYEGVGHWRAVMLLEKDVVLVLDRLTSEGSHRFEQRWQFQPDLTVSTQGTSTSVTDKTGKRVLQVTQALPEGLSVSTVRGATGPYDGWYSEDYEVRKKATVLVYPREGVQAHYATLFTSGLNATSPVRVSAWPRPDGLEVHACAAGRGYHIRVQRPAGTDEAVTVTTAPAECEREEAGAPGPP
ncbi:alginate lyase family protein [Myxococcus sp. RHSTA-1-4]|uniref:alginate lyase family protein n=1 Tax=Myxococcus sp. RHSTA-1-4 TaxID=2874601 RepID=UPI001CBB9D46|nr:alginate lyase family protein [Myxococcus sp. RHSTA-1-4]MBZ4422472.1 heparinase II/III family protein [Myxococcus sp. RHSTA-1-4]